MFGMGVSALLLAAAWAAFAVGRTGSGHSITIDATTAGGGPSGSSSYREADSAVGQGPDYGFAGSASYTEHAGCVLSWAQLPGPPLPSTIRDWKSY